MSSSSSSYTDDVDSVTSSSSSLPPTPSQRAFPRTPAKTTHRPDELGVDPSLLIGKVLRGIRRSRTHPVVTLYFTDNTAYQILVDGYDPRHRGVPKFIETDPGFEPFLSYEGAIADMRLTISNAACVTLADKAHDASGRGSRWDQTHRGIALKFEEENRWHCMWATLEEYEDSERRLNCLFRNFHDVYLSPLATSASGGQGKRPQRRRRPHGRATGAK